MIDRSPSSYLGGVIGQRYRVESLLGQGGMGVLFVAEHLFTHRKVALKLLHPAREDLPDLRARFVSEARTAAATRHPNIVDVLDMGLTEDGSPFLVMELLEGVSLDQLLQGRGKLSPADALECLLPITGALALLHDAGIVHRDIKPSNIFLATQANGNVCPKLLDFGLARAISDLRMTRSGVVLGTPMYMAPEQASGDDVSTQSDVWSFGVVLFECITGEPPFNSHDSQAVAVQVLAGRTRPIRSVCPEIPMPLADAVERCLRGNRELRYRDMRELAANLVAGARASQIRLPADPDPIGLPEYRRWLAGHGEAVTTQELEIPSSAPAAGQPFPVDVATPVLADSGASSAVRPQRTHAAIAVTLLALLAVAAAWYLRSSSAPPTAHPPKARPSQVQPISAPPEAKRATPPPPLDVSAAPVPADVAAGAPPAPPAPTAAPDELTKPGKPPRKEPRKTPPPKRVDQAGSPSEGHALPRTQGGVELEGEWK